MSAVGYYRRNIENRNEPYRYRTLTPKGECKSPRGTCTTWKVLDWGGRASPEWRKGVEWWNERLESFRNPCQQRGRSIYLYGDDWTSGLNGYDVRAEYRRDAHCLNGIFGSQASCKSRQWRFCATDYRNRLALIPSTPRGVTTRQFVVQSKDLSKYSRATHLKQRVE